MYSSQLNQKLNNYRKTRKISKTKVKQIHLTNITKISKAIFFPKKQYMNIPHQISPHPQQSSKYIDSQKIYPKRLGTYQNGNALVLQYYNLAIDKFKKHVIPLDLSKSFKENVDMIYKNPKHSVLLRKVQPKYVQNVLKGESVMGNRQQSFGGRQEFVLEGSNNPSRANYNNPSFNTEQQAPQPSSYNQQQSYSATTNQYTSSSSLTNNHNDRNNNENQISSIIDSRPSNYLSQQAKEKIEDVEDYYEEEFQDFQISQSMGKKNQPKKQPDVNLSLNSNPANQSLSVPLQSKYNAVLEDEEKQEKKQKKQKKTKKSKDGKKSKKKKESQIEEDQFDFDFLDGDGAQKKKPTKPKETSKEKSKTKQKSKEIDNKTTKKVKQQQKPKLQKKPTKQQAVIQDDFDFDL